MPSELLQNSLQELRQQRNRQQEEMAQLDASIAADRIRRAAERARLKDVQRVAVDVNAKIAERVLSSTHAVLEAKLAETAVKEKELQAEIQKRLFKREGERERELVRRTAVRKREAERKSQLKGARTQNKKYVTQSAEFYGADFSKPPENVEIVALQKQRSDEHESIENSEQVRLRGGVFIKAITKAALARRSSMDLFETDGLRSASEPTSAEPKPEFEAGMKRPMRLDAFVRPSLDYSDLFSPRVGKQSGIMVYRVENLRPVPQPGDTHGKFCVADCYIVLHTAPGLDNSGGLEWTIWQWCGSEASLDKRACSAIYSVNLRNFLGATSRIQHESHCEESPEFLQIFEDPIEYLPATEGTDSGLAKAARRRSPLRLYRIYGERNLKARLVAPEAKSLRADGAFLLEQNRQIFVWNGKHASLQSKSKARLLADRLNSSERSGRANIESFDEGGEPEEFWDLLGDRPHVASAIEEGMDTEERDNIVHDEAQSRENYEFEQLALRPPILYRVTEELQPNLRDHDISFGDGSPLKRSLLQTTGCYILDCGVELFLWVGREASASLRDKATELLTQVVMRENRPRWLGLHKIFEFCEVEVFRMHFSDWTTTGGEVKSITKTVPVTSTEGVKVDVAALYSSRPTVAIMEESDLQSLIARANHLLVSMTSFEFVRGRFVRMTDPSCNCLHDGGAFLFLCTYRLEEEGEGESTSPSSPAKSPTQPSASEKERSSAVECVVYFWEGGRAPKASWPTFTLKALSEIKSLAQKQWGAELKVVIVTPFREPVALLAHWNQQLLVRRRGVEATDPGNVETPKAELYHIRTDPQYKATRGVQVLPATASRLVSRDCFYVRVTQEGKEEDYLWVGKGASKDETRRAGLFVKSMFRPVAGPSGDIKTVSERSETPGFWSLLGGKDSPQPGSEFYYVKPPRFFRCEAATTGNYRIEELPSPVWGQRDLRGDTCVILDPGAPEMCYMWVGSKASDVVVKLTKRAVEVYLDHCDDGRQFIGTLVSPRNESPGVSQKTPEEEPSGNRGRFRARRDRHRRSEGDVLMILQGYEPEFFQAFFHGWDLERAGGPKDDKDVGNVFSREEDKRKIRRQQEREKKRLMEERQKLNRTGSRYKSVEDLLTDKEKRLLRMENKTQQDLLASEIKVAAKGRASSQAMQTGNVGIEKLAETNQVRKPELGQIKTDPQMGSGRYLESHPNTDVPVCLDHEKRELNASQERNGEESGQGAADSSLVDVNRDVIANHVPECSTYERTPISAMEVSESATPDGLDASRPEKESPASLRDDEVEIQSSDPNTRFDASSGDGRQYEIDLREGETCADNSTQEAIENAAGSPLSDLRSTGAPNDEVAVPETVAVFINGPDQTVSEREQNDSPRISRDILEDHIPEPVPISVPSINFNSTENAGEGKMESVLDEADGDDDNPGGFQLTPRVDLEEKPNLDIARNPNVDEEKEATIPNYCEPNSDASGYDGLRELRESEQPLPYANSCEMGHSEIGLKDEAEQAGCTKQTADLPIHEKREMILNQPTPDSTFVPDVSNSNGSTKENHLDIAQKDPHTLTGETSEEFEEEHQPPPFRLSLSPQPALEPYSNGVQLDTQPLEPPGALIEGGISEVTTAEQSYPESSPPMTSQLSDTENIERTSDEVKKREQLPSINSTLPPGNLEAKSEPSFDVLQSDIEAQTADSEEGLQEKQVKETEQINSDSLPATTAENVDAAFISFSPETQFAEPLHSNSLGESEEITLGEQKREKLSQEQQTGQNVTEFAAMPTSDPPEEGFDTSQNDVRLETREPELPIGEGTFRAPQREHENDSDGEEVELLETDLEDPVGSIVQHPRTVFPGSDVAVSQEPPDAGTPLCEFDKEPQLEEDGAIPRVPLTQAGDDADLAGSTSNAPAQESTEDATGQVAVVQQEQGKTIPASLPKTTVADMTVVPNLPRPEELTIETKPLAQGKTKKAKKSLFSSSPEDNKSEKEAKKKKRWFQR